MGNIIQMADLFHYFSKLLEPCWCRFIWLSYKSSNCFVLYAGTKYHPVHGHAALFGVFGMLGIGLMLFVLKGLTIKYVWKTNLLSIAFWSLNAGLMLMVLISLLPVGVLQTIASIKFGMWYARSAEFMQEPALQTLRWLRIMGDTVFSAGSVALAFL